MDTLDGQRPADHWTADLRDLLVVLPAWSLVPQRKAFVEAALGGHPAAAELRGCEEIGFLHNYVLSIFLILKNPGFLEERFFSQSLSWENDPATVANDLAQRLAFFSQVPLDGRHPGCALLAEVCKRRYDGNRAVGTLVARLSRAFACEAPPPAAFCPYPGLLAYDWGRDRERARLFFGREVETEALVARLRDLKPGNLLVVSGASGCGKSSLVKAGLWRALHAPSEDQRAHIDGSADWAVSAMTPGYHGDAFLTLVTSADTCNPGADLIPANEAPKLRKKPERFAGFLDRLLAARPAWLLILDQMEELFAGAAGPYREAFIAFLLRAVEDPRLRLVATIRSDFLHYLNDHPHLCEPLNREPPYFVRPPGPQALARMISRPLEAVGLACDPTLAERLVHDAHDQSGGLALLGAALEDLYTLGAETGGLTLGQYEKGLGGLAGILQQRAERGFAILADEFELERSVADDLTRRVFGELVAIDPHSSEATRLRVPLEHWRDDAEARAIIEIFSRTPRSREDNVRLLVCGDEKGEATVEVAHEALLRQWAPLVDWIDQRREDLVRRAEVLRDAARWDKAGRPDDFLPVAGVRRDLRRRLQEAGLWEGVRANDAAAYFLAEDEPDELADLARRAFSERAADRNPLRPALRLICCLTAPGRTWDTTRALGDWIGTQDPALAAWLEDGLVRVLKLLGRDAAAHWHRRRLGIGDLLAVLGDDRPGVGLRPDRLPDIDWIDIAPGPFTWQEGETRTIDRPYRIARYAVTTAQYQVFIDAPDYGDERWWREGYAAPPPGDPRWEQPNRPRVNVAWVEAMAFCRWITARYRDAGLVDADRVIRLPTEHGWERAARGTDGREYPWGEGYRPGYANVDETAVDRGGIFLRETAAVGLYPRSASPDGVLDCAGSVWEWCLNKYADPDEVDTKGGGDRSLRGGSWFNNPAGARAAYRLRNDPVNRNFTVGFRLVCACPIDSDH
jgi:formylglycine-generating enzyme required for sulfatase activity/energy-coupling factor transporter ATP-binding protein EcfA2